MSNLIDNPQSNYAKKRYIFYSILTCIALILPFIRIGGNYFFLLSFDKKQLHLLFNSFDTQELYLMPFVLIIFFLTIFFLTTLGGRVWCGWSCPQTIFRVIYRDLIQTKILKLHKNISNKQKPIDGQNFKKFLGVAIWSVLACLAAANFLWFFVPPEDFISYVKNGGEHKFLMGIWFFITAFIIFDVVWLAEKFCVYICPYARIQSVMFDDDTIQVIYDEGRGGKIYDKNIKLWKKPPEPENECIGCEACVKICPTHIDIRKGMQLDCINCLECVDACSKVMGKLGKKTLIDWTSDNSLKSGKKVNYLRFRTIAYMVVIGITAVILAFMSTKKEYMLLNINRTSELYKITKSNRVENAYTFLFQNTDNKEHAYYFDVNDTNIKIDRPKDEIVLKAGAKKKVVVVLSSNIINFDKSGNKPISININAYAKDDKERVNINRETIFVYPDK
ncbi:cytochrome c oxidase accessory protein CcoG [Campylobacter sp. RM16189]|uniref:cytochrome c oxidase accessory protein CcoG n=1 Tax=Campylobacter sp. RM16189 TaxID=1705726 RepID=UPI00147389A5|nr:cytochrome c oxidase accessory protein CcoG [Campylobacter sp. RM16189]